MIWLVGLVFLSSLLLTGALRAHALKQGMLDHPNPRSSHTVATPRGGGLAIVVSFLAALLILYVQGLLEFKYFLTFTVAGGMVAAIGYWDDHGHIPARWRIIIHFLAAGLSMLWLDDSFSIQVGSLYLHFGWLGYFVGGVALVWLLNLYNFMDGIDGIAGMEAITVTGGASLLSVQSGHFHEGQTSILLLQLMLLAAVSGFLIWNWPPAKIFMGDVGSGFLGFVIGLLASASMMMDLITVWSWIILLGVFMADATTTLVRRMLRGARWYEAHRSHAYQHAARRWNSHRNVTSGIAVINVCWLLPLAWSASIYPKVGWMLALVALLPLVLLAFWLNAGVEEANLSS